MGEIAFGKGGFLAATLPHNAWRLVLGQAKRGHKWHRVMD
jgi:hypothetical protein